MPKKDTKPLKNKAAKEKGLNPNAADKEKIKKTEEKKQIKREPVQMNYMKDIAKNIAAKKNTTELRETRADRPTTNRLVRSPRMTDNTIKTKREAESMTPALRNFRPQTA